MQGEAERADRERALFRFLSKAARKGELADVDAAAARLGGDLTDVEVRVIGKSVQQRIAAEYEDAPPLHLLLATVDAGRMAAISAYDWVQVGIYVFGLPPTKTRSGTAESAAHRALKEWAAANPERLGAPVGARAETEVWFPSGDESDAAFSSDNAMLIVEVRPGRPEADELRRALFQCVKYREVQRAADRAGGRERDVRTALVVPGGLPAELCDLAVALEVEVVEDGPV